MSSAGAELRISGVVQGVGYRYYCYRKAIALGLAGQVKNEVDGSVFIAVEGDRGAIEAFIEELRIGPPSASVTALDVQWVGFEARYRSFDIAMCG